MEETVLLTKQVELHLPHHQEKENFWTKYLFSTDHKMIAKQFLITGIAWAIIGGLLSMIIRLQLGFDNADFTWLKPILGKWVSAEGQLDSSYYLGVVTMHGTIMMFFVLTAGLSGTFSNLLIPLQIGARDMASGFMNMLSYWFFVLASVIMLASFWVESGPAMGGWTVYPPLSALPQAISGSGTGMTLYILGFFAFIISTLLGGINYITTVINLRTKGMSMKRLPLTVWAFFFTAIIALFSFPVLFSALLLLFFDSNFGTSFYLSDIYIDGEALHHVGGSPLLYQHLFWFLGHPEVYIIFLPALGITSEIVATNARKPIFGYTAMVGAMGAIVILSFVVWAHHMFVSGMNPFLGSAFMILTLMIAIPSAVKGFNYLTTLWKGNIIFTPAMLFSIGLVSFLFSGGVTGIVLGNSVLDIQLHDTYFVVAHFHLIMGSAAFFGTVAGVYHWFPKMYGRMMNEQLGYVHFWITFVGIYMVFFPMHYLGIAGFPRRYYSFTNFEFTNGYTDLNMFISIAAIITFSSQLIFLFNFFYSIFWGRKAPQNPWRSNTLEWTTPVDLGHGNWVGELPTVYRWAYDYSKPNAKEDFIPQNIPLSETVESNFPHEQVQLRQEQIGEIEPSNH
ncbi:MAG: cbb3-type cytochrome c oxidase subunit I [Thermoflexibacter sp.]